MKAIAVLMVVFGLAFVALGFANHRAIRWRFQARRYADPAAHEPSGAGFRLHRVLCFAVAAMAFWGSFSAYRLVTPDRIDHDELLERIRSVAEALDGATKPSVPGEEDGSWDDYIDPELRGPESDDPTAWPAWRSGPLKPDGNEERYDVSGENATVCLTVTAEPSPEQPVPDHLGPVWFDLRADVADGECTQE
ncbi:hypothetical protein AB0903_29245 [Streptomyces sp. NPDC048389]|uniref:hypothetical protein n=1 Tax=Streptomyces sp. NPDC048389 TaxID=3154622 RepID=UPI00345126AB